MKQIKTKTIRQSVTFKATPTEIYEMLMDSKKHSKFTGAKAKISSKEGGSFSAYEGGLVGKNLELKVGKKIVQVWQCVEPEWPKTHFSKLTISLTKSKTGTKLSMIHAGVPSSIAKDISDGWKTYYWEPMKVYLEENTEK
ncbi:SRPBCC domain-containing protein [Candidatus Micrarchaeota archaeon]|nr:SRPBCC domain-containing protein [Candidatus Micrarchaeota archaeon]